MAILHSLWRSLLGPFFWLKCGSHSAYKGRWSAGRFNGHGTVKFSNGSSHTGFFLNGSKHGFGTFNSSSGYQYSGEWLNGRQTGKAYIRYKNGDAYYGQVNNGERCGQGELFCLSINRTYRGVWTSGRLNGECEIVDPDWQFAGEFNSLTQRGKGQIIYRNGDLYNGESRNFIRCGFGELTFASGKKIIGKWIGQANVVQAKMEYGGDITVEGNITNFEPDGLTKITFSSGQTYTGQWEDGNLLRALSYKHTSGRKPNFILI